MNSLLSKIAANPQLHIRWLNTLSYLENCGARKIAACQHSTKVQREMLKHAAEEFRHAFHLKEQIRKLTTHPPIDYSPDTMLGASASLQYLNRLDIEVCRFLKANGYSPIRDIAYLLVTYAIELRADALYPEYHKALKSTKSTVTVKSIMLEEEEHLREMEEQLKAYPESLKKMAIDLEATLFENWLRSIEATL